VQDALGDHRDLVLLAQHLRENSDAPGIDRLAAECERRAGELLTGLDEKLAAIAAQR
jgi:hypothetical protein